ncbi:MAG TPA: alpha/beta hydrolase [Nocardioidaceae bacterium]|nr:alpha/beta hydrolase [Nocardioidaceae bacterium]
MADALIGRMVRVAAGNVHVREDGPVSGRPVVLVHGMLGSIHWYDAVAAALSDTFRVVRLDLLGHGRSDRARRVDGRAQARMLVALLEALDLEDAVVVGHSFGNDATVGAAALSPRVTAVVIVGQGPDHSEVKMPPVTLVLRTPVLGALAHRLTPAWVQRLVLRPMFAPTYRPTSEFMAQAFRDHKAMAAAGHRAVIVDRTRQLGERPLDAQLRERPLPTLAVLGRHDCFYNADNARRRYEAAGARVVVLEDSGHNVNVEKPLELAALIREFAAQPE